MQSLRTVEQIFGTRARVAVLRVLSQVRVPLNTSQVAVRANLSQPAASAALDDLAKIGVVDNHLVGKARVHWIVSANAYVQNVVKPVFGFESDAFDILGEELRSLFETDAVAVVLFGSYARREQRAGSDIDIMVVGEDESAKTKLEETEARCAEHVRERWGAPLRALIYDASEAADLADRAPELHASVVREGITLHGPGPAEWWRLSEPRPHKPGSRRGRESRTDEGG